MWLQEGFKPTGWVACIDVSGVIAEYSLIAFGPTALRFAETEMFSGPWTQHD